MHTKKISQLAHHLHLNSRTTFHSHFLIPSQKNLSKKHANPPDPYSCPILIIGDSQKATGANSQAFWQVQSLIQFLLISFKVSVEDDKIVGFIPLLHRTDTFHTLKSHPLISFEVIYDFEISHQK
jgi:hypothetical protein